MEQEEVFNRSWKEREEYWQEQQTESEAEKAKNSLEVEAWHGELEKLKMEAQSLRSAISRVRSRSPASRSDLSESDLSENVEEESEDELAATKTAEEASRKENADAASAPSGKMARGRSPSKRMRSRFASDDGILSTLNV